MGRWPLTTVLTEHNVQPTSRMRCIILYGRTVGIHYIKCITPKDTANIMDTICIIFIKCVCVCQSSCTPTSYEPGKAEASVIVEAVWQQCISRSGVATKRAKEDGNCPIAHPPSTVRPVRKQKSGKLGCFVLIYAILCPTQPATP